MPTDPSPETVRLVCRLVGLAQEFATKDPILAISNLNTYNLMFLMLGALLHWRPRNFLNAVAKAVPAAYFDAWVAKVRGAGSALDDAAYAKLAKPSKAVPPTTYRSVEPKLFDRITKLTVSGPEKSAGAARSPATQQAGG